MLYFALFLLHWFPSLWSRRSRHVVLKSPHVIHHEMSTEEQVIDAAQRKQEGTAFKRQSQSPYDVSTGLHKAIVHKNLSLWPWPCGLFPHTFLSHYMTVVFCCWTILLVSFLWRVLSHSHFTALVDADGVLSSGRSKLPQNCVNIYLCSGNQPCSTHSCGCWSCCIEKTTPIGESFTNDQVHVYVSVNFSTCYSTVTENHLLISITSHEQTIQAGAHPRSGCLSLTETRGQLYSLPYQKQTGYPHTCWQA